MPKVIPVAIRDQTGDFIRQMAQGNEALARLYISLLARYEERLAAQEYRSGERAIDREERRSLMYEREDLIRGRKTPDDAAANYNPMSRGGGGDPRKVAPPPAATPPATAPKQAQPQVPPAYKPMPSIPGADIPGSQQFKPQGLDSKKFSALDDTDYNDPMNAYAQGTSGATDFSAQSRQPIQGETATRPEKGTPEAIRPSGSSLRDPTRLPSAPSKKARTAEFLPIRREWLDMMDAEEKKHGLPQGSLLTIFGMENGGGRVFGKDPNRAYGMFQFTKALRDERGISDEDTMNPAVMIPAAADNLRRNANELKRIAKVDLPNTAEYMPYWTALHQWGIGDGPRLVATALRGAGHMQAKDQMLKTVRGPDGRPRDNAAVLINNQLPSNITVADVIADQRRRGNPYHTTALRITANPDAHTPDDASSNAPPRPPADIPNQQDTMGANPRLVRAIRGGASLALPDGYIIRQSSGHRPGDSGYHGRREASDFVIFRADGSRISNKGEDTTGLYTRVARGVKTWLAENDPGFQVNWGGAHSTLKRGGTRPDLMHFDTGRDRGELRPESRMSRLKPLGRDEYNAPEQGRTRAVATAAAPAATPDVKAQVQIPAPPVSTAYTPTPMEGKNAAATAAMFDVKPQEPLADMMRGPMRTAQDRGFGEGIPRPIPRQSELQPYVDQGPQQAQAQLPAMPPERGSLGSAIPSTMPEMPGTAALPRQLPPIVPTPQPYGADFDAVPPAAPATPNPNDVFSSGEYANVPEMPQMPQMQVDAADEAARMAADPVESTYPDIDTSTGVPPDMGAGANVPPIAPQAPTPPATPATPQAVDKSQMGEYSPFNAPARQRRGELAWQGAKDVASGMWQGVKGAANAARNASEMDKYPQDYSRPMPDAPPPSVWPTSPPMPPSGMRQGASDVMSVIDKIRNPNLPAPDYDQDNTVPSASYLPSGQEIRDAIYGFVKPSDEARPAPQLDPLIGSQLKPAIDAMKRSWQEHGKVFPPEWDAAVIGRQQEFLNAVKQWMTDPNAPTKVKTINPNAPADKNVPVNDPARIRTDSSKPKNFPGQRMSTGEGDEPLIFTKPPGSAYVPWQGMTPGSPGNVPGAPVMPKKGVTTPAPTTQAMPEAPAGFVYRRVGPGQFIAEPVGDAAQQQQEQPEELVVE